MACLPERAIGRLTQPRRQPATKRRPLPPSLTTKSWTVNSSAPGEHEGFFVDGQPQVPEGLFDRDSKNASPDAVLVVIPRRRVAQGNSTRSVRRMILTDGSTS